MILVRINIGAEEVWLAMPASSGGCQQRLIFIYFSFDFFTEVYIPVADCAGVHDSADS